MSSIYVKTWSGSGTATVTDMTNAGKRGKLCRSIHFMGWTNSDTRDTDAGKIHNFTFWTLHYLEKIDRATPFEVVAEELKKRVAAFRLEVVNDKENYLREDEIRGVDAPKVPLSAGVDGLWHAGADEQGVCLRELNDVNEWTEITPHNQRPSMAYQLAAKVWDKVKAAKTRYEASTILRDAGCKLHGFCGLD